MTEKRKSLAHSVRGRIDSYPYIKNALSDGLVNYSALARKLGKEIGEKDGGKKINEESLIVAIKRYADEIKGRELPQNVRDLIGNSTIAVQDDVSFALFESTEGVTSALEVLLEETNWQLGELRIIVQAAGNVFLLLKSDRMKTFLEKNGTHMVENSVGKSMVSITPPKEAYTTFGVLSEITSTLAQKGISIETISVPPDIHFIVDANDAEKTYHSLRKLINKSKEGIKQD